MGRFRARVQDPHALEDLTGLTELHNSAAALMMEADDDSEDEARESLLGQQGDTPAAATEEDWLEL